MSIKSLFNKLIESYIFVLLTALFVGIIFSKYAVRVAPYNTIFLGIIFFFSALKIDLKEVTGYLKDKKMIVVVNLFMLFFLPIIAYYLTRAVYRQWCALQTLTLHYSNLNSLSFLFILNTGKASSKNFLTPSGSFSFSKIKLLSQNPFGFPTISP